MQCESKRAIYCASIKYDVAVHNNLRREFFASSWQREPDHEEVQVFARADVWSGVPAVFLRAHAKRGSTTTI